MKNIPWTFNLLRLTLLVSPLRAWRVGQRLKKAGGPAPGFRGGPQTIGFFKENRRNERGDQRPAKRMMLRPSSICRGSGFQAWP